MFGLPVNSRQNPQQQGKIAQARQMLAEIYGWFSEGFDTADLQEAKTLLEELSRKMNAEL